MTAGRVAVVTGGASGIGLATCSRLAEDGFTVAALDLQPAGAADVAALTAALRRHRRSRRRGGHAAVPERFGGIDVLVNNAGITGSQQAARCHETPVEEWDKVHAVNVRGPFLCSRAVLPRWWPGDRVTSSRSRRSPG